jgi:hypothetical protein
MSNALSARFSGPQEGGALPDFRESRAFRRSLRKVRNEKNQIFSFHIALPVAASAQNLLEAPSLGIEPLYTPER